MYMRRAGKEGNLWEKPENLYLAGDMPNSIVFCSIPKVTM